MSLNQNTSNRITFKSAMFSLAAFAGIMGWLVIGHGAPPQIPILLGCAVSCIVAARAGFAWEVVEKGIIEGITQALTAIVILLLIGCLVGTWIAGGVVPTMIYYGLRLISPEFFLVSSMLLCVAVSFLMGAWGSAGTVGVALMGIAKILDVPEPLAAGAVISGCYVGELLSPISDAANLVSAVSGVNILKSVKAAILPALVSVGITAGIFMMMGFYVSAENTPLASVTEIREVLASTFHIGFYNFIPVIVLMACIVCKVSSIQSLFISTFLAGVLGIVIQKEPLDVVINSAYYGYECICENGFVSDLLSAGGIVSMMETISLVFIAMIYGGIMEKTGMIHAFMEPIQKHMNSLCSLTLATLLSCIGCNMIMADQYVGIALPGKIFASTYDKKCVERTELGRAIGAGGCATSPLIPWNTCGVYMSTVLGCATIRYLPYAIWNFLVPAAVLFAAFLRTRTTLRK